MKEVNPKNEEKSGSSGSEAFDEIEEELMLDIRSAVQEYAEEMQVKKVKSLARHNPEKVAKVLYLFSTGNSQTRIVRHYKIPRNTVVHIMVEFADHIKKFKELGGKLAARNYVNMSSLEEDLIERVRDRMQNDPDMQVSFKDLKELSIAKINASREALTARGEATSIVEERKTFSDEDYAQEIAKVKAALAEDAEVLDVEDVEDAEENE
jgi:hypothetical protein